MNESLLKQRRPRSVSCILRSSSSSDVDALSSAVNSHSYANFVASLPSLSLSLPFTRFKLCEKRSKKAPQKFVDFDFAKIYKFFFIFNLNPFFIFALLSYIKKLRDCNSTLCLTTKKMGKEKGGSEASKGNC